MAERSCRYLDGAEALTGYRVKIWTREAFHIVCYTLIVPPGSERQIGAFWDAAIADGRLERLMAVAPERPWVLGLGSWDPACAKGGQRYTICIEETAQTDFSELAKEQDLFRKRIGASDWMCFEMTHGTYLGRFWKDNAYKMMPQAGLYLQHRRLQCRASLRRLSA